MDWDRGLYVSLMPCCGLATYECELFPAPTESRALCPAHTLAPSMPLSCCPFSLKGCCGVSFTFFSSMTPYVGSPFTHKPCCHQGTHCSFLSSQQCAKGLGSLCGVWVSCLVKGHSSDWGLPGPPCLRASLAPVPSYLLHPQLHLKWVSCQSTG